MHEPPRRANHAAPLRKLAVLHAEKPTLSFFRYLYDTAGAPWHWTERRLMSDDDLAAIIHDDKVEIFVLYVGGVPAGFFELDFRQSPRVELAIFGLLPEFTGQRLGSFLLQWAVDAAWRPGTEILTVKTNTADHPRALSMYQKVGFAVVDRGEAYLMPTGAYRGVSPAAPEQDD